MLSRAGAVKVGRRANVATRSLNARSYLDASEHGSTLAVVGWRSPRGAACGARILVPHPCIRWVRRPDHDAV